MVTNAHGQNPTHQKIREKHVPREEDQMVLVGMTEVMVEEVAMVAREETLAILLGVGTLEILLKVVEDPKDLALLEHLQKAIFVAGPLRDEIMHHCAISF